MMFDVHLCSLLLVFGSMCPVVSQYVRRGAKSHQAREPAYNCVAGRTFSGGLARSIASLTVPRAACAMSTPVRCLTVAHAELQRGTWRGSFARWPVTSRDPARRLGRGTGSEWGGDARGWAALGSMDANRASVLPGARRNGKKTAWATPGKAEARGAV